MSEIVNMHEAKSTLSRLVERALARGRRDRPQRNAAGATCSRAEEKRAARARSDEGLDLIASDFDEMSEEALKDWEGR